MTCTKVGTIGADTIFGTSGIDVICGLGGNDKLYGLAGNDTIDGGPGNDFIDGGLGNDKLFGGIGNDTLNGGPGTDTMSGGGNQDVLRGNAGADAMNGGPGTDTVTYSERTTWQPVTADLDNLADDGVGLENDKIGTDVENLTGGAAGDALVGNEKANALKGGPGNDTLDGGPGADTLEGGPGSDHLSGGPATDALIGGSVTAQKFLGRATNGLAGRVGALSADPATTDTLSGGAGDDGFAATSTDTVVNGSGGAVCPAVSTISIECTRGAVVTGVTHESTVSPTGAATVTVLAHVIDFAGTGLTKVVLAATGGTTPNSSGVNYFSATPSLVAGTPINGDWSARFSIPASAADDFGIRLFTEGFVSSIFDVNWNLLGTLYRFPSQPYKCISTFALNDYECGNSGTVLVSLGFPLGMPAIHLGAKRGYKPPTLTNLEITPTSLTTGDQSISLRIQATAHPGTKIASLSFAFRPPEASGRTVPDLVFTKELGVASAESLDFMVSVNVPLTIPGDWALLLGASSDSGGWPVGTSGPNDWRGWGTDDFTALGLPSTVSVTGPELTRTLDVVRSGVGGTITSNIGGIFCGATCAAVLPAATRLTLTASPSAGRTFTGWSGAPACSTAFKCEILLRSDMTVTATFG